MSEDAGTYEPREVSIGRRADDYTKFLRLAEGEKVVTSANFLIDSESRFKQQHKKRWRRNDLQDHRLVGEEQIPLF